MTDTPASAVKGEAVACPRCYRGEVFSMSTDDGFWVEMGAVAGGANEHGMNGWLELIEHHPDGREVRREYVAKDSPLQPQPSQQASPAHSYCNLAGCPMPRPARPPVVHGWPDRETNRLIIDLTAAAMAYATGQGDAARLLKAQEAVEAALTDGEGE